MLKFTIKSKHLAGFAAESVGAGEKLKVLVKAPLITSDDPLFYIYIRQITNLFLTKVGILSDSVFRFLIVLHIDDTADIYINDFGEIIRAKVNKDIKKGEFVYSNNIIDITDVKFPDIEIKSTDTVIYCSKINWKFGLYFDFTRKIDIAVLSKELGELRKKLAFDNIVDFTKSEIRKSEHNIFIITEGKTDWQHLEKAKEKLKIDLNLSFDKYEGERGDRDTLKMCEHLSRAPNDKTIIFVFDRDNPLIIKELERRTAKGLDYQSWGNNVYSFLLPIPSHRKKYSNISIEFFYKDEEIKTKDKNGKRLFFDNELKKEILPNRAFRKLVISQDKTLEFNKKIDDQDVEKIIDGNNNQVALSKSNFALNIFNEVNSFNNFDFTEFNKIFSIIKKIITPKKHNK